MYQDYTPKLITFGAKKFYATEFLNAHSSLDWELILVSCCYILSLLVFRVFKLKFVNKRESLAKDKICAAMFLDYNSIQIVACFKQGLPFNSCIKVFCIYVACCLVGSICIYVVHHPCDSCCILLFCFYVACGQLY